MSSSHEYFSQISDAELENSEQFEPIVTSEDISVVSKMQSEISKIQKIHRIDINKLEQMKQKLYSSKIFFNMIIHDMRGPVNSMKLGLEQTIDIISGFSDGLSKYKEMKETQDEMQRLFMDKNVPEQITKRLLNLSGIEILNLHNRRVEELTRIKKVNAEIQQMLPKRSNDFLYESYRDIEKNEIDESFFEEAIGMESWKNRMKMSEFQVQESKSLKEKKQLLRQDLKQVLKSYQIDIGDAKNLEVINYFVGHIFKNINVQKPIFEKPIMVDRQTQTNDTVLRDFLSKQQRCIDNLQLQLESDFALSQMQQKELLIMKMEMDELLFQKSINEKSGLIEQNFMKTALKEIKKSTNEAIVNLEQQVYSQEMMEGLINDMLDQAKIDNDVFKLNQEYFDMLMVVYKALNIVKTKANFNKIQLIAEVENPEHISLLKSFEGDEQRYLQILCNFLSNSLKFTPENGTIRVVLKVKDHQLIKNLNYTNKFQEYIRTDESTLKVGQKRFVNLQISIIDNGQGISQKGLDKLFLDFGKLDENSNQNRQGTGLGLSICKRIAKQMNGTVSVQSKVGFGTSFDLCINSTCKIVSLAHEESLKLIMALEDGSQPDFLAQNPDSHIFLLKEHENSQVEQNISKLKENRLKQINILNFGKHFVNQKKDLLKQIKERYKKQNFKQEKSMGCIKSRNEIENLPVVKYQSQRHLLPQVIRQNSSSQEESKYQEESKVSDAQIIEEVMEESHINIISRSEPTKVKCLVVNDCQMQLLVLTSVLTKMNFEVHQATNGFQALQMVQAQISDKVSCDSTFAFILMDLNMPISDGYDACQKIRSLFTSSRSILYSSYICVSICLSDIRPIIVACTSDNVNHPSIADKIAAAKFDHIMETPISHQRIIDILQPCLDLRKLKIEQKLEIQYEYEQYHQSINLQKCESNHSSNCYAFEINQDCNVIKRKSSPNPILHANISANNQRHQSSEMFQFERLDIKSLQ